MDALHLYTPLFPVGTEVTHRLAIGSRGIVTAFMVRGNNRSYEVTWGIDRSVWHMECEISAFAGDPIGFPVNADSTGERPTWLDLPGSTC